jgi:hypothetical protein
MTPRRLLALAAALVCIAAACNGTGSGAAATPSGAATGSPGGSPAACATSPSPAPDALAPWNATQSPTIFPQIINPAGTIACGQTRFMFSFLDAKNVPVASPDRSVKVALYDLGKDAANPVTTADAKFIWAIEGSVGIYVADVAFPSAGSWGAEFQTEAADAAPEKIRMQFDVQPTSTTIAVGDKAPASDTLTLADVGGDVARISTDTAPVKAFYETSVADAVAAKKPFVLVFATPKFCASRTCGPTLDRIKPIAAKHPELTFINVEPYQLESVDGQLQPVLTGDPAALTLVPAANEWKLAAEPWVFVVDRDGVVTSSLMLVFGDEELEAAIAAVE